MTPLESQLLQLMERYEDWNSAADIARDLREAARLGAAAHQTDCASRGCMWCREQMKVAAGGSDG